MNSTYLGVKLLLLCGIIFVAAGLFPWPAAPSIDIYVHATYFVIGGITFLWLAAFSCWVYALIYYLGERGLKLKFSSVLVVTHVIVTVLGFAMVSSVTYIGISHQRMTNLIPEQVMTSYHKVYMLLILLSVVLFVVIFLLAATNRLRRTLA